MKSVTGIRQVGGVPRGYHHQLRSATSGPSNLRGFGNHPATEILHKKEGLPAPKAIVQMYTKEEATAFKQVWSPGIVTDFKGGAGDILVHYSNNVTPETPERVFFTGLGDRKDVSLQTIQQATSTVVQNLKKLKVSQVTFAVPQIARDASGTKIESGNAMNDVVSTIVNAALLTNYQFDKYKSKKEGEDAPVDIESFSFLMESESDVEQVEETVRQADILARATMYARDLANERGNVCTPEFMENEARALAATYESVEVTEVITGKELVAKGLEMFHAVGQGAEVAPRLVILKYEGNKDSKDFIGLVGKGVTFDTGGIHLKPTNFIEEMYMDMSGSATVLATFQALAELKLPVNVYGALCLAENATGSKSYLPSSILRSYKGLTVEIGNTDAEGRLVLADSLTYVQKDLGVKKVINLATLTGACVVALGEYAAGLFGNNDQLIDDLYKSGEKTTETVWKLPILPEHSKEMQGSESDLVNIGKGRYGGASTAAAFLKEFIEEGVEWAHIDIAGPAMSSSQRGHIPKHATGFGVQLLVDYLKKTTQA